jgi:hypothetical protein
MTIPDLPPSPSIRLHLCRTTEHRSPTLLVLKGTLKVLSITNTALLRLQERVSSLNRISATSPSGTTPLQCSCDLILQRRASPCGMMILASQRTPSARSGARKSPKNLQYRQTSPDRGSGRPPRSRGTSSSEPGNRTRKAQRNSLLNRCHVEPVPSRELP